MNVSQHERLSARSGASEADKRRERTRADVLFAGKRGEDKTKIKTQETRSALLFGYDNFLLTVVSDFGSTVTAVLKVSQVKHPGTRALGRRRSASQLGEGLPDTNHRPINCFVSLKGEHKGRHLLQVKLLSIVSSVWRGRTVPYSGFK